MWCCRIDIAAALRMRDLAGVDLLSSAEPRTLTVPETVNCIYAVCFPQAQWKGMSDVDFARSLKPRSLSGLRGDGGAMLAAASDAFREGLSQFWPEPPVEQPKGKGKPVSDDSPEPLTWKGLFEIAGAVRCNPHSLTLRELIHMAVGANENLSRHLWQPASVLAAKGTKVKADDLNPWSKKNEALRKLRGPGGAMPKLKTRAAF